MNKAERKHCTMVASLGCIICGQAAELHHVMIGTGLSQRSDHYKVIPLCHAHHRTGGYGVAFHAGSAAWIDRYETEQYYLDQVDIQLYSDDVVRIRDPEYRLAG